MTAAEVFIGSASVGGAAFGGLALVSTLPRSEFWGGVRASGDRSGNRFALTFDDGPSADSTARILDALGELNAPAAFFVIGANAKKYPELVRRMQAEGHVVGNHSFSHDRLSMFRGLRYWRRELERTDEAIRQLMGVRPTLFRPPMGVRTYFNTRAARDLGYTVVTWSRRGLDGIATTTKAILNRLEERTRAGDILMLHDGAEPNRRRDSGPTVEAIRPLIQRLRARGLEPARLDGMLGLSAYAPAGSEAGGA